MTRLKIKRKPKEFWAEKFTTDMPHAIETLGTALENGLVYGKWKCPEGVEGGVPVIEHKGEKFYISDSDYIIRDNETDDILEILNESIIEEDYEIMDSIELKEPDKPEPQEQDDPEPDTKKKS